MVDFSRLFHRQALRLFRSDRDNQERLGLAKVIQERNAADQWDWLVVSALIDADSILSPYSLRYWTSLLVDELSINASISYH